MLTDLQGMDLESHLHPYTNFADITECGPMIVIERHEIDTVVGAIRETVDELVRTVV